MKKYILIAGVNGAGKSTLYQTITSLKGMPRVNTDEIVRELGDWKNPKDVFAAGKIAVTRISEYFQKGLTFNQETTLCGRTILKNIKKAKELGYFVEIHYVGVESAEIAKERVKYRVACGGHGIPDSDIERRYWDSFVQLRSVMNDCDLVAFYDNSERFRRFAIFRKGKPERISKDVPKWFLENVGFGAGKQRRM